MAVAKEEKVPIVELNEEEEGNLEASADYFFEKIGEAVPLKPVNSGFDLQSPPAEPLAVSDRFQAIFVAHSEGFYVAKTKDVIEAAKEIEEKKSSACILELSLVDVLIGKVHILALSMDSSTLAACVGSRIHFFSVPSLLNKGRDPSFSCSLGESSHVKDFHWRKKLGNSYVVLSRDGVLYQGEVGGPLKEVMDHVDAVNWSTRGNYIVVAREKILTILSSKFRERLSMSLMFKSWVNDSDPKGDIKVDCIKWVRPDCILLGCFRLNDDGNEDGYIIQMITSRDGKITKASSNLVVLSFREVFPGFIDDILPFGSGPHLFLYYLEHWELAIAANRKNTDDHIVLFGWSLNDEQKEAAVIELSQEGRWLPRIGLQENEDDNLIMGFGVDKVSLYEKVKVKEGVEQRELSPYCLLLCLTLEGKLVMFYVAGVTENQVPSQISCEISDEEEDSLAAVSLGVDTCKTALLLEEHGLKEIVLDGNSKDTIQQELTTKGEGGVLVNNEVQITKLDSPLKSSPIADDVSNKGTSNNFNVSCEPLGKNQELLPPLALNTGQKTHSHFEASKKNELNDANLGPRSLMSGQQSSYMEKFPINSSFAHGFDSATREGSKSETQKYVFSPQAFGSKTDSPSMPILGTIESKFEVPAKSGEMNKQFCGNIDPAGSKSAISEPQSTVKLSSDELKARSSSFSLTSTEVAMPIWSTIQSNFEVPSKSGEINKQFSGSIDPAGSKSALSEPQSSVKPSTDELKARSSSFSLISTEVKRLESSGSRVGNASHTSSSQTPSFDLLQRNIPNTKEPNIYPQSSTYSSGRATLSGQRSAGAGKFVSAPAFHISKISSHGSSTYGNSQSFNLQPVQENLRSPQPSSLLIAEAELSKHFGSVNDMAKELDTLLSYIEEEGGFSDACTTFQKSSVLALEHELEDLSGRCRIVKNLMEDRHEEIQCLLDRTVQVIARKIYIDGILKQASDSQYGDLLYRQKLSPELELKQRQILKLNQDLTNQLIQLERHFNSLEINGFSKSSGASMCRRDFHTRLEPSRHNHSVHSLYNTTNSQLAAAEQLSERLSKQMTLLNIELSSVKKQSVAKELFESIGLDYDGDSFKSPIAKNVGCSPESISKLHFYSSNVAIRDQSSRQHFSATKNSESETARRRRDSLDQSWANFEPSRTTVKRMLLQGEETRVRGRESSSFTDKEGFTSPLLQGIDHPRDHTPPHHFNSSINKHELNKVRRDHGQSQSTWLKSPAMQVTQRGNPESLSSVVAPPSSSSIFQDMTSDSWGSVFNRSSIEGNFVGRSDSSKGQSVPFLKVISDSHSETPPSQAPQPNTSLLAQRVSSSMKSSNETSLNLSNLKSGVPQTRATSVSVNVTTENSSAATMKSSGSPFPHLSTFPPVPTLDENVFQLGTVASKSQVDVPVSASTVSPTIAVSSSLHLPAAIIPSSSTPPLSSSGMSFGGSVATTKPSIDASQTEPLVASIIPSSSIPPFSSSAMSFGGSVPTTQPSVDASLMLPLIASSSSLSSSSISFTVSSSPFSTLTPKEQASLLPSSASINVMSQAPPTKLEQVATPTEPKLASVPKDSTSFEGESVMKSDVNATSQASALQSEPPRGVFSSNSAISVTSAPLSKVSASFASGSQPSFSNIFSSESIVSLNSQLELSSVMNVQLPEHISGSSVAKNENLDLAEAQEDEMEEEAPDTTTALNLGSLGGFGLGSAPTSSAIKPNPFGGSFPNTAGNPFALTVPSGEMFRPASFSFQPAQPSQPNVTVKQNAFSGSFNSVSSVPGPTGSAFGQPAHLGPGQQALGTVLGAFGQSRQLGTGLQGTGFASASGFGGGGFSAAAKIGGGSGFGAPSTGGFANATTGGGFAGVASTAGGFAGAASGVTGFAAAAASSSSGFAGAAAAGGGFGAFSNKQGSGGFSAFGNNSAQMKR